MSKTGLLNTEHTTVGSLSNKLLSASRLQVQKSKEFRKPWREPAGLRAVSSVSGFKDFGRGSASDARQSDASERLSASGVNSGTSASEEQINELLQ